MRGFAPWACVSIVIAAGCSVRPYRVEVIDRVTGEPVTAVVEVAHVDASPEHRELHWTRDVWLAPGRPAGISLWSFSRYRVILFERPDPDARIPDRDQWTVLARWPRPLRPRDDANRWHESEDGRFELRMAR